MSILDLDGAALEIASKAQWLQAGGEQARAQFQRAADAGAKLAAAAYVALPHLHPGAREALNAAYGEFMGQHSGNFT